MLDFLKRPSNRTMRSIGANAEKIAVARPERAIERPPLFVKEAVIPALKLRFGFGEQFARPLQQLIGCHGNSYRSREEGNHCLQIVQLSRRA